VNSLFIQEKNQEVCKATWNHFTYYVSQRSLSF